MARPTKTDDDRRSTILKMRMTPCEYDQLKHDAMRAGKSVSEIARRKVLGEQLVVRSSRHLPVEAFNELRKIGVNLNQIARRMNATPRVDPAQIDLVQRQMDRLLNLMDDSHEPGPR